MGLDKKMLNQEENTHMSYIRLKVNKFIRIESHSKAQHTEKDAELFEKDEDEEDEEEQLWDAEEENRKSSYFVLL